ncbi:MAG: M3 family metallopeptidase [bacterium]
MQTSIDSHLPNFTSFEPSKLEEGLRVILETNKKSLTELLDSTEVYTWDNLVQPLEEMEDRLSNYWSPASHLNSVMNSDALRESYNACLPLLTEYSTDIGQNEKLFLAYKSISEGNDFEDLSVSQKKTIENALRDFEISGVGLDDKGKKQFKELSQNLSHLTTKFEENLLDATNDWELHIEDPGVLDGLPETAMSMARQNAENKGLSGYLVTLQFPSYYAVITYANSRDLREKLYKAYSTRASDQANKPDWDNSAVMAEILDTRLKLAKLLGFSNYAERSMAKKMAETPEKVLAFLHDLAERTRDLGQQELEDLANFAKEKLEMEELSPWDVAYASEKYRQKLFHLSQEDLKPYFPVDEVVNGLFDLVKNLYHIDIKENIGVDVWHPDVRFYDVYGEDGKLQAQFYFDLYAREKKRGGAWMDVCRSRMMKQDGLQIPVAYMTCNSTPPVGDTPSLFTHDEVITLFHEFGHGLHHMLTEVDHPSVSGISGVEWDAVELPSQFMENWCWERTALDLFARHHETGESLPNNLYNSLIASKHFQAAMQTLRQVEFAIFDLRIHMEHILGKGADEIQSILDEVREEVAVLKPPSYNRFQHGFSHIFAGGYAAGYYSYKWAEVLSADAFARFEEEGLYSPEVGKAFLDNILKMGGSRTAMENFIAFRGREPVIDALLRHNGLDAT